MKLHPVPKDRIVMRDTAAQDRLIDRKHFFRRHGILLISLSGAFLAILLLGLYLRHYAGADASVDRSRLSIATVERGSFVRDVSADGQVVAAVSPTLYANAPGRVSLKVHAGDAVVESQVLAVIESPELTARLLQEQASLAGLKIDWKRAELDADQRLDRLHDAYEQAEVDRKTAQRERDRSRKAYELGSYSELQALKAEDALEKAQFAFLQAKNTVDTQPRSDRFDIDSRKTLYERQQYLVVDLQHQVDGLQIRSPVDGQVGQILQADRASVPKDSPLLTVVDLTALEVEIKVTENQARDLRTGMAADIESGNQHWQGRVDGVSPEVVAGQVTARVRFGADKPQGLRQSQRLAVRIVIDRRDDVLMIDRGSFVDQEGGFAYVVTGSLALRRTVQLGAVSVAKVEIRGGLSRGDQVIISGADVFKDAPRVILSN